MSKWKDKYLLGEICMSAFFLKEHPNQHIKITATACTVKTMKENMRSGNILFSFPS